MCKFFIVQVSVFAFLFFANLQSVFAEEVALDQEKQVQSVGLLAQNGLKVDDKFKKIEPKNENLAMVNFDLKEGQIAEEEENPDEVADPLYYFNYGMFYFNDFLQNYALEPVSTGYKTVTPEFARVGMSNFFSNLQSPVNIFNHLFQLNFKKSGTEFCRLLINSTIGVGGFYDAADNLFDIKKKEAGFGQTLGYYGIGHGIYIVWPIFGPSSARETLGFAGDKMMSPATYLGYYYLDFYQTASITTFEKINDTSFKLGDYKLLVGNAVEPYDALKDAFEQYNKKKIRKVTDI